MPLPVLQAERWAGRRQGCDDDDDDAELTVQPSLDEMQRFQLREVLARVTRHDCVKRVSQQIRAQTQARQLLNLLQSLSERYRLHVMAASR